MGNVKRRTYQSPLRRESARRTRRTIVRAAGELFVTKGYAAASLADVATAAGVARPTVFASYGSKAALLREVIDQALTGDDEPVPVAQRPWFRPVWEAATSAELLAAYAEVCTLIGERAAQCFEAVRRAADAAPEAAELWQTLLANRRTGARMVIERLTALGPLRDGLDPDRATDVLWLFNDPALYDSCVRQCGWRREDFRDWLAGQMRAGLLSGTAPL